MPCIEEWLSNPLLVVDSIKCDDVDSHVSHVKEYFGERLKLRGINKVPSLNEKCLDDLKPNTLVRFRCMIQDMFEPEYYLYGYETIHKATGEKNKNAGLYRDVASCKPGHEVDINSPNNITDDRQCFYCVPIPGETTWAKKTFSRAAGSQCTFKDSKPGPSNSLKRDFGEMQQRSTATDKMPSTSSCDDPGENGTSEDDENSKRQKHDVDGHQVSASTHSARAHSGTDKTVQLGSTDLNFPLPDDRGPACIVKVYDIFESYKVNDMFEFVGVLSVDPLLTTFNGQRPGDQAHSVLDDMEVEEQCPQSLPSSLVPRIHAIIGYKLRHSNPLVDVFSESCALENLFSELAPVRETVLKMFQEMLYGDSVAAEYLLLHVISTVYSRPDVLTLGKYTLNLIGCSKEVAQHISRMVEHIVSKHHRFPVTISNLNKSKLVPKKDYTSNRLISGKLQLSDDTHLILDETVLEEGHLDNMGVQNISALNHIISWQKVQYDFSFYKTDFPTNVVILVLSEGKSLLKADSRLPIHVQKPLVPFEQVIEKFGEGILDNIRKYITLARLISYEISSELQKYIEDDFVEMRQAAPGNMTVERFHSLLCLARLMALSHGRGHLLLGDWMRTKELERIRQSRLPQGNQ